MNDWLLECVYGRIQRGEIGKAKALLLFARPKLSEEDAAAEIEILTQLVKNQKKLDAGGR